MVSHATTHTGLAKNAGSQSKGWFVAARGGWGWKGPTQRKLPVDGGETTVDQKGWQMEEEEKRKVTNRWALKRDRVIGGGGEKGGKKKRNRIMSQCNCLRNKEGKKEKTFSFRYTQQIKPDSRATGQETPLGGVSQYQPRAAVGGGGSRRKEKGTFKNLVGGKQQRMVGLHHTPARESNRNQIDEKAKKRGKKIGETSFGNPGVGGEVQK